MNTGFVKWRERLADAVRAYGGPPELVRDAHVYGGGALVAAGAGVGFGQAAGLAVLGLLLIFLGLRRG